MPIPLTDLDDRTFADLLAEARALIPTLHPGWTDHNPSDPGMALVELFAWLTEMLVFQVNEIPESHTARFLALLNGPAWTPPPGDMDAAVRDTVIALHERYRAATPADYEYLVSRTWPGTPEAAALGPAGAIRRVRCVPGRNLAAPPPPAGADPPDPLAEAAHVSVVVLPEPAAGQEHPAPDSTVLAALEQFLEPRRLLTTRQHVVGPEYVDVQVSADLALPQDSPPAAALAAAGEALRAVLSPVVGGDAGTGWPFGRDVYTSELYAQLERVDLLDYAENLVLTGPAPIVVGGATTGLSLDEHQLPRLTAITLTGYDDQGRSFPLSWRAS